MVIGLSCNVLDLDSGKSVNIFLYRVGYFSLELLNKLRLLSFCFSELKNVDM